MISVVARLLLTATSFAPILFTLAFVDFRRRLPWWHSAGYVAAALLLTLVCMLVLREARTRLQVLVVPMESVKSADKEVIAFVLTYLLPLVNTWNVSRADPAVLWFVIALLFWAVLTTNGYHFNPLLTAARLHFYEVTSANKVGFILISRRRISDPSRIGRVVQLADYILLECE